MEWTEYGTNFGYNQSGNQCSDVGMMQEKLKCKTEECNRLKEERTNFEEAAKVAEDEYKRTIHSLQKELHEMKTKFDAQQKNYNDLKEKYTGQEKELKAFNKLKKDHEQLNKSLQNAQRNLEELRTKDKERQKVHKHLDQKCSNQEKELHTYKISLDKLKNDYEQLHNRLDKVNIDLADEKCSHQEAIRRFNEKIKDTENSTKTLTDCLDATQAQLKERTTSLALNEQKLLQCQNVREDLSHRLAKEWNNKVASDESNTENIAIMNRPMNIADEYSAFCTGEWLDAKNEFDEKCIDVSEKDKNIVLCHVLLNSEKLANIMHCKALKTIVSVLTDPLNTVKQMDLLKDWSEKNSDDKETKTVDNVYIPGAANSIETSSQESHPPDKDSQEKGFVVVNTTDVEPHTKLPSDDDTTQITDGNNVMDKGPSSDRSETLPKEMNGNKDKQEEPAEQDSITEITLPSQMNNIVGDFHRMNADGTDMKALISDIETKLLNMLKEHKWMQLMKDNVIMKKYTTACAKLAWKMVLQRPKMEFYTKGMRKNWQEKYHEPFFSGYDPTQPDSVIEYYIYPALFHGDKIMVKGKVFTMKDDNKK